MNRRQLLATLAGGTWAAAELPGFAAADERQPSGDLGNGTYRNPIIVAGDIADIGSVRVGKDYYRCSRIRRTTRPRCTSRAKTASWPA